jgi:mRNA interferase MazF
MLSPLGVSDSLAKESTYIKVMYIKDFDSWNDKKKEIEKEIRSISIRSGEIRWFSCGVNIGSEIDGKGESFTRPCLIVHVIGKMSALVIPMSSKKKEWAGRREIMHGESVDYLCIDQMKIVSQKRIFRRVGRISETKLSVIKKVVSGFYSF